MLDRGAGAHPPLDLFVAVSLALLRPEIRLRPVLSPASVTVAFDGTVSADGFDEPQHNAQWQGVPVTAVERLVLAACATGAQGVPSADLVQRLYGHGGSLVARTIYAAHASSIGNIDELVAHQRARGPEGRSVVAAVVQGLFPDEWAQECARRDEQSVFNVADVTWEQAPVRSQTEEEDRVRHHQLLVLADEEVANVVTDVRALISEGTAFNQQMAAALRSAPRLTMSQRLRGRLRSWLAPRSGSDSSG